MTDELYPALTFMLTGFFRARYDDEGDEAWPESVFDFVPQHFALAAVAVSELDTLLARDLDERGLREVLRAAGLSYSIEDVAPREWLLPIRDRLASAVEFHRRDQVSAPYPALTYMLTGYFHEDYDEDGEDWPEVVDFFAGRNPDECNVTIAEIDRLLASDRDDEALRDVIRSCGSVYYVDPGTAVAWLQGVRDRLASHAPS